MTTTRDSTPPRGTLVAGRPALALTLAAALLIPVSPAGAQSAAGGSDEAEVRATVDALFDAMRAADSAAVVALFSEDAGLTRYQVREGRTVTSVTPIGRFASSVGRAQSGQFNETIHDVEIRVDGNLALAWTPYVFHLFDEVQHCGTNLFVLFKGEEGWKITYLTDTRRQEGCGGEPGSGHPM